MSEDTRSTYTEGAPSLSMNDLRRVMDTRVPVASLDVAEAAQKLGITIKTCSALPPNTLVMVDWEAAREAFVNGLMTDAILGVYRYDPPTDPDHA